MRFEGDYIKINKWLLPLSWFYGLGVNLRNQLFELGILRSRAFSIPIISVGNITVGGSGKTPHVEYLVELLHKEKKVAVLSRGYKRKSRGYQLATADSTIRDIGDEPPQIKQKYPDIYVAVDKDRCEGIDRLTADEATKDVDVILLDDAYQHRYVRPGINILLIDYHRLIIHDTLLPAGRLREPKRGKRRADIVIVTKCPHDLNPMEFRVLTKQLELYPYQDLYFTNLTYGHLQQVFGGNELPLDQIGPDTHALLLTGIASPQQIENDLQPYVKHMESLTFADHHYFRPKDIRRINGTFVAIEVKKIIITTEKDATRLREAEGLSDDVKNAIYVLPVNIHFMLNREETFNHKISSYVLKNSRNSILVKAKDDNKSENRNHLGNGPRTISFRDN